MARYLSWSGLTTKVFNVGEYRREATQDYRFFQNNIWFKLQYKRGTYCVLIFIVVYIVH